MTHDMPERDPHSEFEDEGIPDLQSGTPGQEWAVDPQRAPMPGEEPAAAEDFGTTADEQADGEPLDQRMTREEPEDQAAFGDGNPVVRPARGESPDRSEDPDALTADSGLGVGADLDTAYQAASGPGGRMTPPGRGGTDGAADWPAQPEEPSGRVWEEPRPAGRLVGPDEGARPDEEKDEIADEVGPDSGGYTAEEAALRVEPE